MGKNLRELEILDTTLRDGEQTPGVSFSAGDKLEIARMLLTRVRVDRLEIGSARVSEGERAAVGAIFAWGAHRGLSDRLEILGFVDGGKSVGWIAETGGKVINLLAKGSEAHCRVQLRKTPAQHYADVAREIALARERGLEVNVYLEDWSRGMRESLAYVFNFLTALSALPVSRIMLADTLGELTPGAATRYFAYLQSEHPELRYDFHAHNDYGLATANSLAAVEAGIDGVHTTVNGLGERAGNQPLSQLVSAVHDFSPRRTRVHERELLPVSALVEALSGKRCAWNTPITGGDVFTQTCGVHADGDKKGDLYVNRLLPERFGRRRDYALGKLSGKASLERNLDELGIDLAPAQRAQVLAEVVRLGDRKKEVTASDLPFIVAGVMGAAAPDRLKVLDYRIETCAGKLPRATLKLEFDGEILEDSATGDGGYDAFAKALRKVLRRKHLTLPRLTSYEVRIPPGGKTDALVETRIVWQAPGGGVWTTTGVDCDQVVAAVIATEKMLNRLITDKK